MSRFGSRTRVSTYLSDWMPTGDGYFIPLDFLVVAGGGSGGSESFSTGSGGGGGAGGLRSSITNTGGGGDLESVFAISLSTNYLVQIGAGATIGSGFVDGRDGSASFFSSIISVGGGGGAGNDVSAPMNGRSGGSGGGCANTNSSPIVGSGVSGQGFSGGVGVNSPQRAGGGGGAGAVGVAGVSGGTGGAGVANSITGSSVTYAGGGGGAGVGARGLGGAGGGGNGALSGSSSGGAGTANNGGGGGGGCNSSPTGAGTGGSGIVILRYLTADGTITIGAGLTGTTATDGSYKVTTITAGTGNVSWA